MRIRWATASKSAKSGETDYAPALAVLPTKQRGLWSFLTWSFFLSQVMAGKSFFPDDAHAAQDDYDGVSAHATSDANSTFDDMPRAASGMAALAEIQEDQAAASQHNNHLARSVLLLEGLQRGGTALGRKLPSNDAEPDAGGGGGGGSDSGDSNSSGSGALDESLGLALDVTKMPENFGVSQGPELPPGQYVLGHNVDGSNASDLSPSHLDALMPTAGFDSGVDAKHVPEGQLGTGGVLVGADVSLTPVLNPYQLVSELPHTIGLTTEGNVGDVLGFDVHVTADGIFVGANVGLSQVLSPDHLVSDPGHTVGLTTAGNLSDVLGFDVRVTADGIFVGANVGLSQVLSPDHLASDLAQTVELTTKANLSDVLSFDAQFGVASLLGVHGGPDGLPVSADFGEAPSHLIKSTLAEVTGLQLFGDGGSLTAQLVNNVDSDTSASITKAIDVLTEPVTSKAAAPVAHVIADLTDVSTLKQNGDIGAGDSINFPAQKLAQSDELFSGAHYTDYHVTLQSQNPDTGNTAGTLKIDTVDHAEALPSPTDKLSDSHHEATAPPTTIEHATDASLAQISLPVPHLNSL